MKGELNSRLSGSWVVHGPLSGRDERPCCLWLLAAGCRAAAGARAAEDTTPSAARDTSTSLQRFGQTTAFHSAAVLLQAEISARYFSTCLTEILLIRPRRPMRAPFHSALSMPVTRSRACITGHLTWTGRTKTKRISPPPPQLLHAK